MHFPELAGHSTRHGHSQLLHHAIRPPPSPGKGGECAPCHQCDTIALSECLPKKALASVRLKSWAAAAMVAAGGPADFRLKCLIVRLRPPASPLNSPGLFKEEQRFGPAAGAAGGTLACGGLQWKGTHRAPPLRREPAAVTSPQQQQVRVRVCVCACEGEGGGG